jgi:hypothetical protein
MNADYAYIYLFQILIILPKQTNSVKINIRSQMSRTKNKKYLCRKTANTAAIRGGRPLSNIFSALANNTLIQQNLTIKF